MARDRFGSKPRRDDLSLPERRRRVVLNSLVGMAGALVAVLVSYWVIDGARPDAPVRLAFAAVGAWVGLGLTHALWVSRARHAPRLS
jgi:hypothetical protein